MIERILPGTSIEIVASARETALGVVGVVAMPLELDWGDTLTHIRAGDDTFAALGYKLYAPQIKLVREVMRYANELYLYRLNEGTKATGTLATDVTATARYGGVRGNALSVVVSAVDDRWLIQTMLGTQEVDAQIVKIVSDFQPNDFIELIGEGTLEVATVKLIGGDNGAVGDISGFMDALEKLDYNMLVYTGTNTETKTALKNFIEQERENGRYVQATMSGVEADNKAIYNSTVGLVMQDYKLTPAEACATMGAILAKQGIDGSATYFDVTGAVDVQPRLTKLQMEARTQNGEILFVSMHGGVKVLYDKNTLVTYTDQNPQDFGKGLVVRTLDKYATDLRILLDSRAIGKIRNSTGGRNQVKGMIYGMTVANYLNLGYIEGFTADDVTVEMGASRDSVVSTVGIRVVDTVDKIYVTVTAL